MEKKRMKTLFFVMPDGITKITWLKPFFNSEQIQKRLRKVCKKAIRSQGIKSLPKHTGEGFDVFFIACACKGTTDTGPIDPSLFQHIAEGMLNAMEGLLFQDATDVKKLDVEATYTKGFEGFMMVIRWEEE